MTKDEEIEFLRHRVGQLEDLLGVHAVVPREFQLTTKESALLGLLLNRVSVTRASIIDVLYGDRPEADEPEFRIIDVFVCRVRRKIGAFGVQIGTDWGCGYHMTAADKAKVAAFMVAQTQSQAVA